MNNAITSIDASQSTWALFGGANLAPTTDVNVSISPAGLAAFNQSEGQRVDAIMPATGMSEVLKTALLCMLVS